MNFYQFEYGSGDTWGAYLVPAEAYTLSVNRLGQLTLSSVVPASVSFKDVQKFHAHGDTNFCLYVHALLRSKP